MVTDCPACRRQFRIYAWQLTAARGLVQCGFCGERFDALDSLHDHPLPPATPGAIEAASQVDEPQFDIPGKSIPSQDPDTVADSSIMHDTTPEARPISQEEQDLAGQILESESAIPPGRIRFVWGTGLFLLLLAASAQITWFNRDAILGRYPQLVPYARELCEYLHCNLVRVREPSSFIILNRDVRDHPRFNDALLVNLTMENQSEKIQPYPDIRLVLFDIQGRITGYRQFKPADYLDPGIALQDGMPPGAPVHVVLEVIDAAENAVSFEFEFL